MRLARKLYLLFGLAILVCSLVPLRDFAQSGVQYVYDALGRLVGVIDPSGNAAAYVYDAVGNQTAIFRYTSTQISVLNFTPTNGPIGTTVTITGTGFSATSSLDSVKFHGTSATITSATVNQIVTTVPTGATTGTISVTSPAGTFTTSSSFTVGTTTGAPTITSFTPTTAAPGASITITGTNFNTTAANDRLRFNTTPQSANTATSTSISATTPIGTSGHIQVVTPAGTAVSSQDLYVPFGTYTAAQVGYSHRTTLGTSSTVSLSTAGKIGLLIFDATVGQQISLSLSGATFPSCFNVYLFAPDGTKIGESDCPAASSFVDAVSAPYTGTYTVGIDPGSSNTGSVAVVPNNASDVTGTITIGGSPVTKTTTVVGQNIALTFSATSGQVVSLMASSATFANGANIVIFKPDGTPIGSATTVGSSAPAFIGSTPLGLTGTYKIYIDPITTDTGQVTITLYNAAPVTGTITAGGSAVSPTTTTPGQTAQLTFTGTVNERVSIAIQNVSYASSYFFSPLATVSIVKPNGATLASTGVYNLTSYTFFLDVQVLPDAGTYTLKVDPGPYTGSCTLNLYNVPADATGTTSIGGTGVVVTTSTPGQNAQLTFSGTSGQSISLTGSSVTYTNNTFITLYNPDGSVLTTGYLNSGGNIVFSGIVLAQTGTHTLYIDPSLADTGHMTLQVTTP